MTPAQHTIFGVLSTLYFYSVQHRKGLYDFYYTLVTLTTGYNIILDTVDNIYMGTTPRKVPQRRYTMGLT